MPTFDNNKRLLVLHSLLACAQAITPWNPPGHDHPARWHQHLRQAAPWSSNLPS
ncbi:MAG: hypothetical protein U1E74_02970 [Paenacidovorax caeni]